MAIRVIVVEDESGIRKLLRKIIERNDGFEVAGECDNLADAVSLFARLKPEVVFLDIEINGASGIDCAKIIADMEPKTKIVFATAHAEYMPEAFEVYAFDYLVKPFSQTELLMKVKSLLRRYKEYQGKSAPKARPTIGGNISVDTKTRSALKGDRKIALTDKEFDILQFFMEHKGEIVENKDLYEGVWGEKYLPSAGNTIMVHVLNLRKKLEEDVNNPKIIKTVWGKGYKVE